MCKPLCSRLNAIQKLRPPTTVKGCRSFTGMVNFLSIFCQDLQKLLKPIHDLTRKDRPFNWGQEQQTAFDEIKSRLQKPPVLHLPDKKGRFHLYSYTSKYATGSALYQIQNGKPKFIHSFIIFLYSANLSFVPEGTLTFYCALHSFFCLGHLHY